VRVAFTFVAALVLMVPVACGGDDDETTAASAPLAQRFVTAEDAPGSKTDPVEKRETTTDFDTFISALSDASIDPDTDEMTTLFEDAGFKSAGVDARFFGETHSSETSVHVFSSFIEVGSEDEARSALDWLETDQMKPCPMSCAVQRSSFEVDDIPDARGVHRVATAEDIERVGRNDEQPQDDYWIGFTIGPIVYTVVLHGHAVPGTVSEDEAQQIASAYYDRLVGS
jgi:hypothetical protein